MREASRSSARARGVLWSSSGVGGASQTIVGQGEFQWSSGGAGGISGSMVGQEEPHRAVEGP